MAQDAQPAAAETIEASASQLGEISSENPNNDSNMGSVCWAAIIEAASQLGKRCVDREDPKIRRSLDLAISRLDKSFLAAGWSEERLKAFKLQMGEADLSKSELCERPDALRFYREVAEQGAEHIRATTDQVLALPGDPRWGTCL